MANKKATYAFYGIEYKGGKILSPIGWIAPLLKEGNSKVGKQTFTFSLPAGTKGTCICDCEHCYAQSGFYCMKSVKESLERNRVLVEQHLDFVEHAIMAQILADEITMVRIHAAGDFNTVNREAYANMWLDVVTENPTVKFWTYTKIKKFETLFDSLPNANIVPSVLPYGLGFNFGTCEQMIHAYETMIAHGIEPHICECGIDDNHHCENCAGCSVNKYVLFLLHSTASYNAKADVLLPIIEKIIAKQKERG